MKEIKNMEVGEIVELMEVVAAGEAMREWGIINNNKEDTKGKTVKRDGCLSSIRVNRSLKQKTE